MKVASVIVVLGIAAMAGLAGFALGRQGRGAATGAGAPSGAQAAAAEWTCSMHPQVRMPKPGSCPICGMDLIPVESPGSEGGAVTLGEGAQRIASIEVAPVARKALARQIRTVGRIEPDERRVAFLTARSDGRVERVFADYTGMRVGQGDHLLELYSPELAVVQTELLLARRAGAGDPALGLAREKLRLLGVTEGQVDELLRTGEPRLVLTVHAPIGGTVLEKNVRQQAYVRTGDPLYTIADLTRVWLLAEVFEQDLPWIDVGQEARIEVEALPGTTFAGRIAFVDPIVQEATRTVRVRIEIENEPQRLKPGMFARVLVHAPLRADTLAAEVPPRRAFACPMHPEVQADEPGTCRICKMSLEPTGAATQPNAETRPGATQPSKLPLAIPRTAVLDSGTRRIVWVETAPGTYEPREVVLGPRCGDDHAVISGLAEGERVVVRGNFLLDSQAQIGGKPSLLLPKGQVRADAGHAGHAGTTDPGTRR